MKNRILELGLSFLVAAPLLGCATSAKQEQNKALLHQQKSDEAAKTGAYGVAAEEQRKAADSHHRAVIKSIDEGTPIPSQPQQGDKPPGATPKP